MYLIIAAAFAAGITVGHYRVLPWATGWALAALAAAQGGTWVIGGETCPQCGRKAHIIKASRDVAASGLTSGRLCLQCAAGTGIQEQREEELR